MIRFYPSHLNHRQNITQNQTQALMSNNAPLSFEDMCYPWITLLLFLSGRAFMIHNTKRSLCLEDSASTGEVLLRTCDLASPAQQWVWLHEGALMSVASSRCLSAQHATAVRTRPCQGPGAEAAALAWDCDANKLISRSTSAVLSADGRRPTLGRVGRYSKWRSLEEGDICQDRLRLKRASDEPDEFEAAPEQRGAVAAMTEEQREYLLWLYRTEDPTVWNLVLLGVSFIFLLVGFLLLGMGVMASKNRKKIAKYKAAASLTHRSEGEALKMLAGNNCSKAPASPSARGLQHGNSLPAGDGRIGELQAGNIVVLWKDGSTSCLYSDPSEPAEKQAGGEGEEKQEEEEEEEVTAAEAEDDGAKATE
ncbi:solute carrier family 51 subunit beta isoform X2 [Betta splendens]|uniref:Solute carrier family 51 subunit beta isoform X2 n=2 Tax=Betta splendens TaxID=158456 RepID=A0A6P7M4U7_BETSP|nr:solute carrier family 51 subunit beta isoform X2 [Betta splendens]